MDFLAKGGGLANPDANNATSPTYRTHMLVHEWCPQIESYKLRAFVPLSVEPVLLQVVFLALCQGASTMAAARS